MKPPVTLQHRFVKFIPENVEEHIIYVSIEYATAVHRCCCGCGNEVVTPLSPTDWTLIFDGRTVTLDPSIGNWNFPCQSHYWIKRNRVVWAPGWSKREIDEGRAQDRLTKAVFHGTRDSSQVGVEVSKGRPKRGLIARLREWWTDSQG